MNFLKSFLIFHSYLIVLNKRSLILDDFLAWIILNVVRDILQTHIFLEENRNSLMKRYITDAYSEPY